MTPNQKIVKALNGVSQNDSFRCTMDRIVRVTVGDSKVIHPGYAIQMLESRIRTLQIQLNKAKETLREIREQDVVEADEALARASGD